MEKNRKRTQKGESNVYPRNVEVIRSAWSTIEVKIKNETVIEKHLSGTEIRQKTDI